MQRPKSDQDLSSIIERYSQGDDSALGELIERESAQLGKWLDGRMPQRIQRRHGVSDIIQQTAIKLFALKPRFENRGTGPFRKLLRLIASRVLANTIARERTQRRDSRAAGGAPENVKAEHTPRRSRPDDDTPSAQMMLAERIAGMKRCFADLPEADREVIRLVDHEGLAYPAVAAAIGVSNEAARKRHSRAVANLRQLMKRAGVMDSFGSS